MKELKQWYRRKVVPNYALIGATTLLALLIIWSGYEN